MVSYSSPSPPPWLKIFYNNRLTSKTNISKLGLIILITSISLVLLIQITVYAQLQQQQPQPILGVKITSPTKGQQVPVGQLTISGISTDNATTDCTVYTDWNDQKPFQKAVATGPGGVNDYSAWTFTYTDNYHLITNGTNNLTSKLSCVNSNNVTTANLTTNYSVNITGIIESSQRPTSSSAAVEEQQNNLSRSSTSSSSLPPVNGDNDTTKSSTATTTTTGSESVPSVPITPSPAPSSLPSIQEQEEEEEKEVPQTEPEPQTEPQPEDNSDTTFYWDIQ
jgi:hypothetical protein